MSLYELRSKNKELLARMIAARRVERGVRFIRHMKEAPVRWQGHLVWWDNRGYIRFRGNTKWIEESPLLLSIEESPLLLILEGQEEFLDRFGYVAHRTVQERLKLSDQRMVTLGFCDAHSNVGKNTDIVTSDHLNYAWLQALLSYARPDSIRTRNSILDREWSMFGTDTNITRTRFFWWNEIKKAVRMYFEPLFLPVKIYRAFKSRKTAV